MLLPDMPQEQTEGALCIVVRVNASLTMRVALLLFGAFLFAGTVFSAGFVLLGAWPVVPFIGAELLVAGAVVCFVCRHRQRGEGIELCGDLLRVVQRRGRRVLHHDFQRYWAHVVLEPVQDGWYPSRLVIRSHGREVEVGAGLGEEERAALAQLLRRSVGPGWHRSGSPL